MSDGPTSPDPREIWEVTGTMHLEISSVGIHEQLHPGGLSSDGTVSPAAGEVMWLNDHGRVSPGEVGTAVIAGHVVANGRPDVFNSLLDVTTGDTVHVRTETGGVRVFRVHDVRVADKHEVARDQDVWGPNTSSRRLAIITCDATLGFRNDGHRVANLVVIAEAV